MKACDQHPRQRQYRIAFRMMTHACTRATDAQFRRWMDKFAALSGRLLNSERTA